MKENYTHIAIVIDRSGSMASMAKDVIGGFNTLIKDQKTVEGEATITMAQFDDIYEIVHDFAPVKNVEELTNKTFVPRGSTALLDAMGKTMEEVRGKVLDMKSDEQPAKVIFVFITDGEENASSKYNRSQIFQMIKDLKGKEQNNEINWEFVFIGANQDAIQEGGSMGFRAAASMTFDASGDGADLAFKSLSKSLTTYRCMYSKCASYSFEDSDRKEMDDLLKSKKRKYTNGVIPTSIPDLDDGIVDLGIDKSI